MDIHTPLLLLLLPPCYHTFYIITPIIVNDPHACHVTLPLLSLTASALLDLPLSGGCAGNICVYCPGGPDSDFEYSTQSYTGYEPTSMRAIRARYNPYVQVCKECDGRDVQTARH